METATQYALHGFEFWAFHAWEGFGFATIGFVLTVALMAFLLWVLKGVIFSYYDELDILAKQIRNKQVKLEVKAQIGRSLSTFSLGKCILFGLIFIGIVLAAT